MHLYLMCARAQAWHGLPTVLHVQFQVVESLKRRCFNYAQRQVMQIYFSFHLNESKDEMIKCYVVQECS